MRKNGLLMLVLVLLLSLIAACSSGNSNNKETGKPVKESGNKEVGGSKGTPAKLSMILQSHPSRP